jgi:hypothetical protein
VTGVKGSGTLGVELDLGGPGPQVQAQPELRPFEDANGPVEGVVGRLETGRHQAVGRERYAVDVDGALENVAAPVILLVPGEFKTEPGSLVLQAITDLGLVFGQIQVVLEIHVERLAAGTALEGPGQGRGEAMDVQIPVAFNALGETREGGQQQDRQQGKSHENPQKPRTSSGRCSDMRIQLN